MAISPQLPEHNRELIKHRQLTFDVLSDRGNDVAAKFGLRFELPQYLRDVYRTFPLDLEKFNGDASWTLPIPARFIIDREGIIRAADADPDYTTRPEPDDTLRALRTLAAGTRELESAQELRRGDRVRDVSRASPRCGVASFRCSAA